jgi:hypothetical protein
VKDGNDVVATITYGESGGDNFIKLAGQNFDGYKYCTQGNGTNGDKTGGTFYTIVPVYDGTIDVAVILNADKAFYILENGEALEDYNGITVATKTTTKYTFKVSAGKSYKFYAAATKLSFFGFDYTYGTANAVPLTWDAASPNTATLTNGMPAGNVTVSVEYYPQATMADGAVTAATDVKATTEDALVTIDKSKLTGVAKLMYFVSTDAEATAPAYNATGWTDVLPTAANYTEAGPVKVWYYAVGTNEGVGEATATYSDGDMNTEPLTVTLAAAPLWNAEFDLTDAPAEDQAPGVWKTDITGEGVKKGTPVTVTYTGSKKIIGVKAEKKAAPKLLNFSPMGQIFYYYEGETWGEAIQNHPENAANGWSIEEFGTTVTYKGRALCDSEHDDDITKYTVVNPNGGYLWGPEP